MPNGVLKINNLIHPRLPPVGDFGTEFRTNRLTFRLVIRSIPASSEHIGSLGFASQTKSITDLVIIGRLLMLVHLVNRSDMFLGEGIIFLRRLYILATSTPAIYGDPQLPHETLEHIVPENIKSGDIGTHTGNAPRGMQVCHVVRESRAWVVVNGGIHAALYPEQAFQSNGVHSVVKGDGDLVSGQAIADCVADSHRAFFDSRRVDAGSFRKPDGI